ncbi:MAG: hypothetical protein AAFR61_23600 [Bacteroidota bacterium]
MDINQVHQIIKNYSLACDAVPNLIETFNLEKKAVYETVNVSKSYFFKRMRDGKWKPEELISLDEALGRHTTLTGSALDLIKLRGQMSQFIRASGKKQVWITERIGMSSPTFLSRKKNGNWSFSEIEKICELLFQVPIPVGGSIL